jgi:RNA recognition motif-containing protein
VVRGLPVPRSRLESKKVFVGGLAPTVTETELREYFEAYGPVKEAIVMYDRQTNRSRGFGFVTFDNEVRLFCMLCFGVVLRFVTCW